MVTEADMVAAVVARATHWVAQADSEAEAEMAVEVLATEVAAPEAAVWVEVVMGMGAEVRAAEAVVAVVRAQRQQVAGMGLGSRRGGGPRPCPSVV